MNFNSGNHNWNNNNRNNGHTVRPVLGSAQPSLLVIKLYPHIRLIVFLYSLFCFSSFQSLSQFASMSYTLTYDQLFHDLHLAYYDARRHKRRKAYQLEFEMRLEQNLKRLCDELWTRTYQPRPSTCFIINDPKKREVFAAQFRDRIVHHLYYNYTHELFERTFIHDSYSCIRKRGTHFGIHRLDQHIRQESRNYTRPCYVLKMDVKGYFMNIDRRILLTRPPRSPLKGDDRRRFYSQHVIIM